MTSSLIHSDLQILGGKPVIKVKRISVQFISELLNSGASVDDIVFFYPHLTKEGVNAAIQYLLNQANEEQD